MTTSLLPEVFAVSPEERRALINSALDRQSKAVERTQLMIGETTVTNIHFEAEALTGDKFAADSITGQTIASNTITADRIAGLTITGDKFVANTITADHIQAGAITALHLYVTSLSVISANLGSVTAGTLTGVTFQTSASNPRVAMDATGIYAVNGAGIETFRAAADGTVSTTAIVFGQTGSVWPVGHLTGYIAAAQINVTSLSALTANAGTLTAGSITGGVVMTATEYARVELDADGLVAFDMTNAVTVRLSTDADPSVFSGRVRATSGVDLVASNTDPSPITTKLRWMTSDLEWLSIRGTTVGYKGQTAQGGLRLYAEGAGLYETRVRSTPGFFQRVGFDEAYGWETDHGQFVTSLITGSAGEAMQITTSVAPPYPSLPNFYQSWDYTYDPFVSSLPYPYSIGSAPFSAEIWTKFHAWPVSETYFVRFHSPDTSFPYAWSLQCSPTGVVMLRLHNAAGTQFTITSAALSLNTRYYIAWTYDGTTARLYINNALVGSVAIADIRNCAAFTIGNRAGTRYFSLTVDEFAMYTRQLTQGSTTSDIDDHHYTGVNGLSQNPTPDFEGALFDTDGGAGFFELPDDQRYMKHGPPSVIAGRTANQVGTGAFARVAFTSFRRNNNSAVAISAAGTEFTVPVTGQYTIYFAGQLSAAQPMRLWNVTTGKEMARNDSKTKHVLFWEGVLNANDQIAVEFNATAAQNLTFIDNWSPYLFIRHHNRWRS